MSHARDVVYKSEILGVAVHSCALPEGEGCGPMGNHITIGFLSISGSEPTKTCKATKSEFNVGPQSAGQQNAIQWQNRCRADNSPLSRQTGVSGSAHDILREISFAV